MTERNDRIDSVLSEIMSDAEKSGMPWIMGLFNPKLWELASNEKSKCDTCDNQGWSMPQCKECGQMNGFKYYREGKKGV